MNWDDLEIVPTLSHQAGLKAYLYVTVYDEGWPLGLKTERSTSFHNSGHGQEISWQSYFTINHPNYLTTNKSGDDCQWGVLSLAHKQVRSFLCQRFQHLLNNTDFDGLFVCLRSQSKPPDFADEFGFDEPIREDYYRQYKHDIRSDKFNLHLWRELQGKYLTQFLYDLRVLTKESGHLLGVGCPRGDIIGPPLGNASLQWGEWVENELVDDLVVNQSSSQCPSLWINLWPMHQGPGYIQDYRTGAGMPNIKSQIDTEYGPKILNSPVDLYIAWQWSKPSPTEEMAIHSHEAVTGLVYSSFRNDNAKVIGEHKGDWTF